jgi:hypothetical protein
MYGEMPMAGGHYIPISSLASVLFTPIPPPPFFPFKPEEQERCFAYITICGQKENILRF